MSSTARKQQQEINNARDHLNRAECDLLDDSSAYFIDEGFGLLESVGNGADEQTQLARNLGEAYFKRLCDLLSVRLSSVQCTEPELKKLLAVAQALESTGFAAGSGIEDLRIDIARRLLDKYFVGYSEAEREQEIKRLLDRMQQEGG